MIVRSSFRCLTCGQTHTVRIGMGQEDYQSHRFPCMGCGEEMAIGLHIDYAKVGWRTEAIDNAEHAAEEAGAPIMNVDANFIVPEEERHKDFAFPRLTQIHRMTEIAKEIGSLIDHSAIPREKIDERPFRRPDIAAEWKLLKKAWSLSRRGKSKLSARHIAQGSEEYYASDPLQNLLDWMWRFTLFVGQPSYESKFRAAFDVVNPLMHLNDFAAFKTVYDAELAPERAGRYFGLIRDYFSAFAEFGQVHFLVAKGLQVEGGSVASSVAFEATRMFYGNAFESFAACVDILAYLNNLALGAQV
jgi:hypothetical protein